MPDSDLINSLRGLLNTGQTSVALQVLSKQALLKRTFADNQDWASQLGQLPQSFLSHRAPELYAQTLFKAREPKKLKQFLSELPALSLILLIYKAWALLQSGQYRQALNVLNRVEPQTPSQLLGLWWRIKGEVESRLGQEFLASFTQARLYSSGSDLGHCLMQQANAHFDAGEHPAAMGLWSEALSYFDDPYYLAWLRYNMGMCILPHQPTLAEGHFLEGQEFARSKAGRAFLPRVLCSIGAVRRILGEWPRALYSYREAVELSQEPDDLQQAWWGVGHTSRLSRNHSEALRCFQKALQGPLPHDWLHVEVAATHLMLGNLAQAQQSLGKARKTTGRGRTVRAILAAELARLNHNPRQLEKALGQIEWDTLWVKEELGCFPQLFEHLRQAYQLQVEPLEYARGLAVKVRAAGIVHVYINERPLKLKATSRPIELLLALLENENEATNDHLTALLYGDKPVPRAKQLQALWRNVKELRAILGWKESVISENGYYSLDPNATWHYDMRDPQVRAKGKFAEGIYSEWVEELRKGL